MSLLFTVVRGDRTRCSVIDYVELTSTEGTIANIVTHETRCGSHSAPWVIKALPGQVINLTLSDFSVLPLDDKQNTEDPETKCIAYAILREKSVQKSNTVCGGRSTQGHIYISETSTLEIIILGNPAADPSKHFLLHYKGIGHEHRDSFIHLLPPAYAGR